MNKADAKYTAPTEGRDVDRQERKKHEHAPARNQSFSNLPKDRKLRGYRKLGHPSNSKGGCF